MAGKAAAQGISPLEVMLETMRGLHAQGKLLEASAIARDAAPYMHPRLASIEQHIEADVSQRVVSDKPLSELEWQAQYGDGEANGGSLAAAIRPPARAH